ncbi:MAG: type III pantothenate kinase, partial [Candidatus Omnitrophica bacterium]|nr:type III pantothenate kinase [Candidatus Omnitrophota bacterium]
MEGIGVEVGNSNIKIGLLCKKKLVKILIFPTKDIKKLKLPVEWEEISPAFIGIASVVPFINPTLKKKFRMYRKDVFVVTPSLCGLPLKVKNPDRLGVDRVLNCKAALELVKSDVIVIDIGTAITIDYASKKGFMGGVI